MVLRPGICMKIICPFPLLSPQNGAMKILRPVVTVVIRTVSQPGICMKIVCPSPLSPQNGATTNLRLGTVCGFLVFEFKVVTVIVRTVSRPSICMKIVPSLSPQSSVTTNLRLGTVCGFLVFDLCGSGGG